MQHCTRAWQAAVSQTNPATVRARDSCGAQGHEIKAEEATTQVPRKSPAVFTTAAHWTLSKARLIHFTPTRSTLTSQHKTHTSQGILFFANKIRSAVPATALAAVLVPFHVNYGIHVRPPTSEGTNYNKTDNERNT